MAKGKVGNKSLTKGTSDGQSVKIEPRVGKVKMGLSISGFIVIIPYLYERQRDTTKNTGFSCIFFIRVYKKFVNRAALSCV